MSKAFTKESDGDDEDDLPEETGGLPSRQAARVCPFTGARTSR